MAPTVDKRPQPQPHGHIAGGGGGGGGGGYHAKENTASGKKAPKKGLEILDFHESWLEEMEIYKDQIMGQNQKLHLLGAHNHAHTPHGCQYESGGNNNHSSTGKRGRGLDSKSSPPRMRNSVAPSALPITGPAVVSNLAHESVHGDQVQLLLKRPREEHPTNPSVRVGGTTTKRQARLSGGTHARSHTMPPNSVGPTAAAPLPNADKTSGSAAPASAGKVIVNPFHASSSLYTPHFDDKGRTLSPAALTKPAATAYETSLYAANYLLQPQGVVLRSSAVPPTRPSLIDPIGNCIGVSLAKGDGVPIDYTTPLTADDDPCAAIDEVNDYSESDSDDEYVGQAFYLFGEEKESWEAQSTRINMERATATSESEENDQYYTAESILSPSLFPNVPPYLNFSSHASKGPPMPAQLHKVLKWKLSPVMPRIVKRVVLNSGFRIIKNTTDWMAIWEKHMKSPGFRTIRSHQKYNHMPGSFRIGRKDSMWRSIYNNMKKYGRKEFGFMQKSYIMPDDLDNLRQVWPKNASRLTKWIVKPPASARGTGIRIINKWSQFPKDRPLVVQKYIERPLLINDSKFDMRIYVFMTSINPLRIYMYKDGLARFASVKYSSELTTLDDRCMHLTNYSINKFSQNYSKNEDFNACQGHKWTLQSLWSCLEGRGVNTKRLWATLRNLVIRAVISGESGLNRMYRQNVNFHYNCFELFGFDILLDDNLIPWLLEINISPSLHSELPLDLHVKGPLITAVLNTALYQVPPKLTQQQQVEIMRELNLKGPLCHDKRIFTTCLTTEEVRKHNQFTNRAVELREEYLDSILDNLLPDDVRCLIMAEDEYARSKPLERIFPNADTHTYLKYVDSARYYNRLMDAWEHKYGHCREDGIALLRRLCEEEYHLQVSDATLDKEPNVALTEIDMLHMRRPEDCLLGADSYDTTHASKAATPDGGLTSSAPNSRESSDGANAKTTGERAHAVAVNVRA